MCCKDKHNSKFDYSNLSVNEKEIIIKHIDSLKIANRFLKIIINIMLDYPTAETPSQKGLLDFVLSLMNEKGHIDVIELSEIQHKHYIELIKHFHQHWKQRNKNESKNNIYDDPIIEDLGPKACLHILKIYNSEK